MRAGIIVRFGWLLAIALPVAACGGKRPLNTFADLPTRIKPGHTVYLIDSKGVETRGKLEALSPAELSVRSDDQVRRWAAADVRQVQRYGDSLWNGAIIGAAVSVPGAMFADPRYVPCDDDPARTCTDSEAGSRALVVGVGALAGIGIDALVKRRRPVYVAPGATAGSVRLAPLLTHRSTGLAVVIAY